MSLMVWVALIYRAFFDSLYRSLARGARAVFQVYPENLAQRELILGYAMRAGFAGGVVVDFPHRYTIFTQDKDLQLSITYRISLLGLCNAFLDVDS